LKPLLAALLPFALFACAGKIRPAETALPIAWTELGPGSALLARVVPPAGSPCPKLRVDGMDLPMQKRDPADPAFPLTCELRIENGKKIELDGHALPQRPTHVRKIVVIGDTGCRIQNGKKGLSVQACNDPADWPFARIAAIAAAWRPDLVFHMGDLHYREAPCPSDDSRCAGAVSGDNWESWKQDFFRPARPLLAAAPWIFARGNHEDCARGGHGWFQLLDPRPAPSSCTETSPPYRVELPGLTIGVIDSAAAENLSPSLQQLLPAPSGPFWLLLHRPFLHPGDEDEADGTTPLPLALAKAVSLILTGHRHLVHFHLQEHHLPPEVISGNSGDRLEYANPWAGKEGDPAGFLQFGFLTMEEIQAQKWELVARNLEGKPLMVCQLREREKKSSRLSCQQP
jgi:Calcineurin-like phosphoesterase